ncbi:hypothetical protein EBT25_16945 [bacterium]|nr:hypothetical protein [bacterium]
MASINGYQYNTEQEAINARESVDSYYGIPVSPDDVTQNWVDYNFAELNTPQFWYIVYDESLTPVLGTPSEFEVVTLPFPPTN